jgi:hypothetical protein
LDEREELRVEWKITETKHPVLPDRMNIFQASDDIRRKIDSCLPHRVRWKEWIWNLELVK